MILYLVILIVSIHSLVGKGRISYTYGEINLDSMIQIFDIIYNHRDDNILHHRRRQPRDQEKRNEGVGVFYDLGSGVGVPVVMAALIHPHFKQCIGIEIISNLHKIALKLKSEYDLETQTHCNKIESNDSNHNATQFPFLEFYNTSILNIADTVESQNECNYVKWPQNGDIYFINSTCFEDDLFANLETIFKETTQCQDEVYIITLSRPFSDSTCFQVIREIRLDMSW